MIGSMTFRDSSGAYIAAALCADRETYLPDITGLQGIMAFSA